MSDVTPTTDGADRALVADPMTDEEHASLAMPGVVIIARVSGLLLWDTAGGPDWSRGDAGRYTVEAVDSMDWRLDGMRGTFDTIERALAVFPALASAPQAAGFTGPLAPLAIEWAAWCTAQGLEIAAAEEVMCDDNLTGEQCAFIVEFMDRWEAAESAPTTA